MLSSPKGNLDAQMRTLQPLQLLLADQRLGIQIILNDLGPIDSSVTPLLRWRFQLKFDIQHTVVHCQQVCKTYMPVPSSRWATETHWGGVWLRNTARLRIVSMNQWLVCYLLLSFSFLVRRIGIAARQHTHGTAGHLAEPEEVQSVEGDVQDTVKPHDSSWNTPRPRVSQLLRCRPPVLDRVHCARKTARKSVNPVQDILYLVKIGRGHSNGKYGRRDG